MEPSIIIKYADTDDELHQILNLQNKNHKDNLTFEERNKNGFVTVKHNFELLKQMNNSARQIIAKDNNIVVGYALVMLKEFGDLIPVLTPMFNLFNSLTYKAKTLNSYNYYVMGQICISETHRGQGIFNNLYLKHKNSYAHKFELCMTEVSSNNLRSMKAHQNVGFETLYSFNDKIDNWNILLWDWKNV